EDLVDQLLVLAPAAAQQELEVFERRRLDPAKAVALVGGQDRRRGAVPELDLRRKEVLHAAGRRRVELHARSDPATDVAEQVVASAVGWREIMGGNATGSGRRTDACRGHSEIVMMICVSPSVSRKFV